MRKKLHFVANNNWEKSLKLGSRWILASPCRNNKESFTRWIVQYLVNHSQFIGGIMEHEDDSDTRKSGALGTVSKNLKKRLGKTVKLEVLISSISQYFKDQFEYWEVSWRAEETCSYNTLTVSLQTGKASTWKNRIFDWTLNCIWWLVSSSEDLMCMECRHYSVLSCSTF